MLILSQLILQAHAAHSSMLWRLSMVPNVEIRLTKDHSKHCQ